MTALPNGQRCCHNACVNQSCVQVSGQNVDRCISATDCAPGAPTIAIAPPIVPQPKPPVSGFLPWYIIAIPAAILHGIVLVENEKGCGIKVKFVVIYLDDFLPCQSSP